MNNNTQCLKKIQTSHPRHLRLHLKRRRIFIKLEIITETKKRHLKKFWICSFLQKTERHFFPEKSTNPTFNKMPKRA